MKTLPKKIIRIDDGVEFWLNESTQLYQIHLDVPHLDDPKHPHHEYSYERLMEDPRNKGSFKAVSDETKFPDFLVGVPAGPIEYMEASWAKYWITIWDNGRVGYKGERFPTEEEKKDIRTRITKLRELLKKREADLDKAWELMK